MKQKTATVSALKRELKGNRGFFAAVLSAAVFVFGLLSFIGTADGLEEMLWQAGLSNVEAESYAVYLRIGMGAGVLLQAALVVGAWLAHLGASRENGDKLLFVGLSVLKVYALIITVFLSVSVFCGILLYLRLPLMIAVLTAVYAFVGSYFVNITKMFFSASRAVRSGEEPFYTSQYVISFGYVLSVLAIVVACILVIASFFAEDFSVAESLSSACSLIVSALLLHFFSGIADRSRTLVAVPMPAENGENAERTENAELPAAAQDTAKNAPKDSRVKRIVFSVVIGLLTLVFGGWGFLAAFYPQEVREFGVVYTRQEGNFYKVSEFKYAGDWSDMVVVRANYHGMQVKAVGEGAFSGCSVGVVLISNGVQSIERGAFSGSMSLYKVEIPHSVESIGDRAFSTCWGMRTIVIPDSVTHMGSRLFARSTVSCVYCESKEKPEGWNSDWDVDNDEWGVAERKVQVYWGGSWEYVNGEPAPIG